jgi:hypothetical protein
LCLKRFYIFGFLEGIAHYSKDFNLLGTFRSKAVYSIVPYHNDNNIMILGKFNNTIKLVDIKGMCQLTEFLAKTKEEGSQIYSICKT